MPNPSNPRREDAARRKAEARFVQPKDGETGFQERLAKDRAAVAVKTAKLRALRLAKEQAEIDNPHPESDRQKLGPFHRKRTAP